MSISKFCFAAGAACFLLAAFGLWAPLVYLGATAVALGLAVG